MDISPETRRAAQLYLDLLQKCLTRVLFPDQHRHFDLGGSSSMSVLERSEGKDWPTEAETMIGLRRLENLHHCILRVLESEVPGDLVETGVWRGGACIFMRAALKAYGECQRSVWLADSFAGLPPPDSAGYPCDTGDTHYQLAPYLAIPLREVQSNFERYGLLDDKVRFLPGWFKDTLPNAPVNQVAVLRIDGDMYESTMEALVHLYPKLSPGGFVIIDDYGALPNCRAAVEDFRFSRGLTERIRVIDWTGIFWQKGDLEPETEVCFDEDGYLRANPDVAKAVREGRLRSGLEHFLQYGRKEGRRKRSGDAPSAV